MHGDGDNPWQKQRWLNSSPPRSLTVFTSSPFKMWANSIWKTPDVLLSSPLFTSSSLRLLQFVGDFSSFHRNLLCSVYILAVGFTQEPADHHKPHNYLSFHLCFPSRLLKNSTPNPGNPTKFDLLIRSLILTMFLLNILCSRLFFGNSLSSIIYNYNYSCMPNTKQNIDCHNKSTLQSRMNMNFTSVQNNDCWSFISLFNNDVVITSHNRFLFLLNLNSCGIAPSNRLKKSSSQAYLHRFPIPGPYSYQDTK